MPDFTPRAHRLLSRQLGIITAAELLDCGIGSKRRRRLVRHGSLVPVAKGVYRIPSVPTSLDQRCVALSKSHPRGVITGPTAGTVIGLRRMPKRAPIHLLVPHGLHLPAEPGVRLRQTTVLDRRDHRLTPTGIRIATGDRLAFDLAADLRPSHHRSAVEQLLHEELATPEGLARMATRLVHPRRRGSELFVDTLMRRSGAALESEPELRVAEALRAAGVPVIAQETWLDLPNGGRARLDLSVPDVRWGVEIDVHPTHFGLDGATADDRRDRQCHLIGWQIERVTSLDLDDLPATISELVALYRVRCATVADVA